MCGLRSTGRGGERYLLHGTDQQRQQVRSGGEDEASSTGGLDAAHSPVFSAARQHPCQCGPQAGCCLCAPRSCILCAPLRPCDSSGDPSKKKKKKKRLSLQPGDVTRELLSGSCGRVWSPCCHPRSHQSPSPGYCRNKALAWHWRRIVPIPAVPPPRSSHTCRISPAARLGQR